MANAPISGVETHKTNWTIGVSIAAIVVVFGIFIGALSRAHFFTYTGTESDAKVVGEALTLVGGLIGAIVSVLGILLKYSSDRQTEARLAFDADRSNELERQTQARLDLDSLAARTAKEKEETRLKLDSATKIIQLFGTSDGKEAYPIQIAGGLLTLARLGYCDIALDLTSDLLHRRRGLNATTISLVVDQALRQDSEEVQIAATYLLLHHPEEMLSDDGFSYPKSILNWEKLGPYTREWAPIALGRMMTRRPLSQWECEFMPAVNTVLAALARGWHAEQKTNGLPKQHIGAVLRSLFGAFPEEPESKGPGRREIIAHPRGLIDLKPIREEVAAAKAVSDTARCLVAELEEWTKAPKIPTMMVRQAS